jgi:sugar phosphate isomerase/epimerase
MELALAPLTLHRPNPLDGITAAAEAGYDLTGIQLGLYGQPLSPLAHDPEFVAAAQAALARGGIGVLEVSNVVFDEDFVPDRAESLVAVAKRVGARLVQAVCWDPERDRAAEHLALTADAAAAEGLSVALEFMPYSETRNLRDALDLVEAAGRRNVGLLLDTLHFFRSGGVVADLASLDPGKVLVIQLSDARAAAPVHEQLRAESTGNRLIPGDGELPLRELLASLPSERPISLEVPLRALADRPLVEQARTVLDGSRRFLES